jgi:hypothetical protein
VWSPQQRKGTSWIIGSKDSGVAAKQNVERLEILQFVL